MAGIGSARRSFEKRMMPRLLSVESGAALRMSETAKRARQRDPDPALFDAVFELLQRTSNEIHNEEGRPYVATYSYRSLFNNGARESVTRSILKVRTDGFGRVEEAGRLDLSYEWFVLDPRWQFSEEVRLRAWQRLNGRLAAAISR
jgi:hypothetical protein